MVAPTNRFERGQSFCTLSAGSGALAVFSAAPIPGDRNMRIRSCVRAQLKKIEVEAAVEVGGDADGEVEAGGDEGEIPGRAAQPVRVLHLKDAAQMQKIAAGAFLKRKHILDPALRHDLKPAPQLVGIKIAACLSQGGADLDIKGSSAGSRTGI